MDFLFVYLLDINATLLDKFEVSAGNLAETQ